MSDLISRIEVESVLHNNLHALIDTDQLYQLYKDINRLPTYSIPSADILEHARAIKENCEQFSECEGCRFYKGLPFRCTFGICPQEWKLPEGEKK